MLYYGLPLLAYRPPLFLRVGYTVHELGASAVRSAIAVAGTWTVLAAAACVLATAGAATRRLGFPPAVRLPTLAVFSVGGVAASLPFTFCAAPSWLDQMLHQASLGCLVALVLVMHVLADPSWRGDALKTALLVMLVALDLAVVIVLPLLSARLGPVFFAFIGLIYAALVLRLPRRYLAALVALFVVAGAVGSVLKDRLRQEAYGGLFVRAALGQCWPATARSLSGAGAALETGAEAPRAMAESWRAYDPNFERLRLPSGPVVPPTLRFVLGRTAFRLNHLGELAYVIAVTPSRVDYARAVTYRPLIGKLVPSFLWTGKPRERAGQYFGHRYDFLDPADTRTSINLPIVIEAWMNAGWALVLLTAIGFGLVLGLLWRAVVGPSTDPANVALGTLVVTTVANTESNLSLVLGDVLYAVLGYLVLFLAIRAASRPLGARRAAPGG